MSDMKILVVRFRQMGDAILATPLLSTLKQTFPDAEIDFVLNERIAPLFEGHPALNHIISFTDKERHGFFSYINKVWRTVHHGPRYDVIIDMRSTVNTMLFALFSPFTKYRIGIRKPYTWGVFNYRFEACEDNESMIDHNLKLATPLISSPPSQSSPIAPSSRLPFHPFTFSTPHLSLSITEQEKQDFRQYMVAQGIDFSRPVMLVGVTAKLAHKTWPEDRMTQVLHLFIETFPQWQLIFNYAPGQEAENARRIYSNLSSTSNIFLNIEAKSPRQLAAMAANCTAYFGNEGGARHIVHAMGKPSLVICSPFASKTTWLPQNTDILAIGIDAPSYDLITVDKVWSELQRFCETLLK